jgi:Flp pilus assembly protein TadG
MPTWGERINRTLSLLTASNRTLSRATATGIFSVDVVVPAGERWLIKSIGVKYVTSGVAGNRKVRLEGVVDGVVRAAVESAVNITANQTVHVTFAPGVPVSSGQVSGTLYQPWPECIAMPGDIIRARSPSNGDPGDLIDIFVHADVETDE